MSTIPMRVFVGEPLWKPRPRPSYGVELDAEQRQHVQAQMQKVWQERGCQDAKNPCCWVVGPSRGELLRR